MAKGGFKTIFGTSGNDTLKGDHDDGDTIDGLAGNDLILALAGADFLYGGDGNDTVLGAAGDDQINGGLGNDSLDGGAGFDMANYADSTSSVTLDLALTTAQNTGGTGIDTLRNFEGAYGGAFNDILKAGAAGSLLYGFEGNDLIVGRAGADTLRGGAGDDTVQGGAGNDLLMAEEMGSISNDVITGGSGVDTADYSEAAGAVTISLAITVAQNTGGAGTDTITGVENVNGSKFDDAIKGNGAANGLYGDVGNDTLSGMGGNDALDGFVGSDVLLGGAGNDTISGGWTGLATDVDVMTGGLGADTFVFSNQTWSTAAGTDRITDFSHAQLDKIDLRGLGLSAENFIGNAAFSGVIGQMHIVNTGGQQRIEVDHNGDGVADGLVIDVSSVTALASDDFLF